MIATLIKILKKRNYLLAELCFLLALQIIASACLVGPFWARNTLAGWGMAMFGFFRDNLHSLNYFGEIQWWNPSETSMGFPIYYPSILGVHFLNPIFFLLGSLFWLLGQVGITITHFLPVYVLYFGFLIPLSLSMSFLLLLREVFKDFRVILLLSIPAVFSPALFYSLTSFSSLGLQAAVGFLATTCLLRFLRRPGDRSFYALMVAVLIFMLSFGLGALHWNVIFIPLLCLVLALIPFPTTLQSILHPWKCISSKKWALFLVLLALSASPMVITLLQGDQILRPGPDGKIYTLTSMDPGSPMEILLASVPALGMRRETLNDGTNFWGISAEGYYDLSYNYLGMLTLSLLFVGLAYGRGVWRARILVLLVVCLGIVPLVTFSPFMAALLTVIPLLRANSHFYSTFYSAGAFFLILLGSGLGLQALLHAPQSKRIALFLSFGLCALMSVLLLFFLYGQHAFLRNPIISFMLVMLFFYTVVLIWLTRTNVGLRRSIVFVTLLLLTFVDVSTVAFWHFRKNTILGEYKIHEPSVTSIGLGKGLTSFESDNYLKLSYIHNLKNKVTEVVALPRLAVSKTERLVHWKDSEHLRPEGIRVEKQTYNTLQLKVIAPEPCLLFWKDAYHPYWRASVNRVKVDIQKTFDAFKGIQVPAGTSHIEFRYRPPWVFASLFLGYGSLAVAIALWLTACWKSSRLS